MMTHNVNPSAGGLATSDMPGKSEKTRRTMTTRMYSVPPAEQTIPALLERRATEHGTKPFIVFSSQQRSYVEMRDRAAAYAALLKASRVSIGDRVAIFCPNRLEGIDVWFGCTWLGAIMVPINTALRADQLEHVLMNSDPRILVIHVDLLERLDFVKDVPPSLERLWLIDGNSSRDGSVTWHDIPISPFPCPGDLLGHQMIRPQTPAAVLYTGGTTGPSKGVCCPHGQFYWWGANAAETLSITDQSILYTVLPLFHINALSTLSQALVAGATFRFGDRFSASSFWREMQEAGATHTYLLGAMVSILLKRESSSAERAHEVKIALAPGTSADQIQLFKRRFGITIVDAYGSTETNMITCSTVGRHRAGSMGTVVRGFEARVVDEGDNEVAPGTPGELIVRHREPFAFFTGYFRMSERTVEAWQNLWFHTGDCVVRDEVGRFWFVDRLKDAIRRRGENISSYDVENVLELHPDVASAAVVPVPSELGEDEIMAFIVLREGRRSDPHSLIRHCEPRLAYFAIPRYIQFVTEFPLTEVGRVKKHVLRDRGVTESTWDREAAGIVLRR